MAPHLAATATFWPPLGFPLPLSLHCLTSEPFVYTLPLQKPERPDSLYGWARGSEWRCPHSLCRVRAPFQNRITICLPYSSDPNVRCLWFPSHLPPTVILLDCRIKVSHSPLDIIYFSQLSVIWEKLMPTKINAHIYRTILMRVTAWQSFYLTFSSFQLPHVVVQSMPSLIYP